MKTGMLIPDWIIPRSIGLVWPENIPERRQLVNLFYIKLVELLLKQLPAELKLTIIHRPGEEERLIGYFGKERINLIKYKKIQDIWIRDFAPFWKKVEDKSIAIKGRYNPEFWDPQSQNYSIDDEYCGILLGGEDLERIAYEDTKLILDGGILTHNGKGIGICTNRIISSNEYLFFDSVIETLKNALCLKELILIPSEYGDDTGHIDGMVRFISKDKVLVSSYTYKWQPGNDYIKESDYLFAQHQMNEIANYLSTKGLLVKRLPNGIPKENVNDFENAVGNYMNFLRVGDKVFVPQYQKMEDDLAALEAFEKVGFLKKNIIRVLGCEELAEMGGVLNCITTHLY